MSPPLQFRSSAYNSAAAQGALAAAQWCQPGLALMDEALEHIAGARECIECGNDLEKDWRVDSTVSIVAELRSSLDLHASSPLAVNLDDLYDYVSRQLVCASQHNRVATLDEVSYLLREIRCAWVILPYV
jgi:flagellar protein FliS